MTHEPRTPAEGEDPAVAAESTRPPPRVSARALAVVVVIAIAAAAAIAVWLLARGDDEATQSRQRARPAAASIQRLEALARSVGHPIYWAGPQPPFTYELSRTKNGGVYIRYLPPGAELGNANPDYLTVGTYPQANALATLRATAREQGARTIRLAGSGLAFQHKTHPTSAYLAYPGVDVQIEVYDPIPGRARQLVVSGRIVPVR
jgi:hypothetical protein